MARQLHRDACLFKLVELLTVLDFGRGGHGLGRGLLQCGLTAAAWAFDALAQASLLHGLRQVTLRFDL